MPCPTCCPNSAPCEFVPVVQPPPISTPHMPHLQVLASPDGFRFHPSGKQGRAGDFSFHAILRGCISVSHMRNLQVASIGKLLDFSVLELIGALNQLMA